MPCDPAHHLAFTARQRRTLIGLLCVGAVAAGMLWVLNRSVVADPQPESGARAAELADQIDLESADWQTLAILPGIGEKRARDILAKRDELRQRRPGEPAFKRPEDLLVISGIGVATIEKIRPFLLFPGSPTTQSVW